MNRKILLFVFLILTISMLTTPVMASGCQRKNNSMIDFMIHVQNTINVNDNLRWWYDNGESGAGVAPPISPPEGATKLVSKGHIWELADSVSSYITLGDKQIPLSPEDFWCKFDTVWNYDVEAPTVSEGMYYVREKFSFNTAEYTGYLHITSIEKAKVTLNPGSPLGIDLEASGICFGYGKINGKTVVLSGERHFLGIGLGVEDSGVIKFFGR